MVGSPSLLNGLLLLLSLCSLNHALPFSSPANDSSSGVYDNAAVAADAGVCSEIGAKILLRGSAVDAAVASLICVGVVNLHSTGIGGGGFMIYYEAATRRSYGVDYRETAPSAASFDMYDGEDSSASSEGEVTFTPSR